MHPCRSFLCLHGSPERIDGLLVERAALERFLGEHERLDDVLTVEDIGRVRVALLVGLTAREPPTTLVRAFAVKHPDVYVRLEYANEDERYVGFLESRGGRFTSDHLDYHSAAELREFAQATGHIDAEVIADEWGKAT